MLKSFLIKKKKTKKTQTFKKIKLLIKENRYILTEEKKIKQIFKNVATW